MAGGVPASTTCAVLTITALTASHALIAVEQFGTGNASMALTGAVAGAGQASFQWTYVAGSGGGAVASYSPTIRYVAFQT